MLGRPGPPRDIVTILNLPAGSTRRLALQMGLDVEDAGIGFVLHRVRSDAADKE